MMVMMMALCPGQWLSKDTATEGVDFGLCLHMG